MPASSLNVLPYFDTPNQPTESAETQLYIDKLALQVHPEGGYFIETDRDPVRVPNPFLNTPTYANATSALSDDTTRNASTTIYYYLTPKFPRGVFHRNKGRTIHTLHRGRGQYVIIHADDLEKGYAKARVETFVVGQNVAQGEKLQWIVEGDKFKASILLPDQPSGTDSEGLLISETVIPGFEFADHDFASHDMISELLSEEDAAELRWLVRDEGKVGKAKGTLATLNE